MTAGPGLAAGAWDLVGEVQRFGLFSAAAVVDRYAEIVDRAISRHGPAASAPLDDAGSGRMVDTAVAMAGAWSRLVDATSTLLRSEGAHDEATPTLVLPATEPGSGTGASFWIHNTTSSAAPGIGLTVSGLVASDGHRIGADALSVVPDRVGLLAAGTSQEVRVRVVVPAAQPAGCYFGLVMTSAAPAEPMVLRLAVRAPRESGP
ncbi:hypothetical protein [Blastococcus sp. CT_GayMR16]|uniref:hypothetical protein n=1 Tax=Blastococcus sp. CT_GayMR16 TaxID=2559607 RepID=UPI001073872B|nr:hypothetical protein [Blastococcus sp. CT_GayMR16]TFV86971.1 hypothetical protein E4P38_15115 [Blastococcus sp. CT_GayMR16]